MREGLDRGVYEGIYLPDDTSHAELEREEAENPDFLSFTVLLHFPPQAGDVIWVDDRWVNGHAHRDGVPIIGVNDVLRALLQRGDLQESEYYTALLKLRAANVRYIPLEVGEILYHLQQAQVTEEAVVETPELALLHRYIAACLLDDTRLQRPPMPEGAPNPEGETAFVLGTMRATGEAIVACWSDETDYGARAEIYADWILENLYAGLFGLQHLRSDPDPTSDGLDLIGLDIGNELARGFYLRGNLRATEENSSPRRKFFSWLESQVIARRFQADPSAVVAVASRLKKVLEELATRSYDDPEQDMASRLLLQRYFLELPESIRNTFQLDPEVMARLGVTTFASVNVGSLGFERAEFAEAVAETLHGQEGRVRARTTDTEYVLNATGDERTGQVIEIKDHSNVTVATFDDPIIELLRDDPSARQEWLKSRRLWFDCNGDEFDKVVAEIASAARPLERIEKTRAWRETSVAVFYARLEQQLRHTGRFGREDLLPPSAGGFLRHFRLELYVDDADFHDRLHTAASTLLAEEGLRSAINRLGCLPIKLPAVLAEACDRPTTSERQQFFATLMRHWASPVCKLHMIDLALRYARDDLFCLDVARSTFAALCDETNGALHYRLFAALLQAQPIEVYSSNYALYGEMSARVMTTLAQWTPDVEVYSIDEAFLHLPTLPPDALTTYGQTIRTTIEQRTGIPVSIGIGATKTLAKRSPEARGVVTLASPLEVEATLAQTPLEAIWGIGPGYTRRLKANDIMTALQLRDANDWWIRQQLGVVGQRIVWELRGIACLPLERCPPPKKSLMVSRSFGRPITTVTEMREAVATYTTRAAEKLRRDYVAARVLTIFLTTNHFTDEPQYANGVTMPLPVATQDTAELIRYALQGIEQLFRQGDRYKKAGVILTELVPAHQIQTHLFDRHDRERSQRLMAAIDAINIQWGRGTVRYAAVGLQPRWRMRCARRSPRYTTRWEELAEVRSEP